MDPSHRTTAFGPSAMAIAAVSIALFSPGCGSGLGEGIPQFPGGPTAPLTAEEVRGIITQAAAAVSNDTMVIAVVDREGNLLGVFRKTNAPATVKALLAGQLRDVDAVEFAVSLARTGAFFSNDQAPLSSRTVRFISREHFPPTFGPDGRVTGVRNTPSGALWNIEGTNRGCSLSDDFLPGQEISAARSIDRTSPGLGIATVPGGIPLFKLGRLVGGVGVCGVAPAAAEFAAINGTAGFGPNVAPPGVIFIDGVRLPFVEQTARPVGTGSVRFDDVTEVGVFVSIPDLQNPNQMIADVQSSLRSNVPEGWLVGPKGGAELSEAEVRTIIQNCVARANRTRAAIRLPLEERTKMVIAVTALDGDVLGLFRMPDATVFSIDVAVSKARNVVYFSGFDRRVLDLPGVPFGTAVTNRTLRFGSQPFFPAGIDDSLPGPFVPLLLNNFANPCTQGFGDPAAPNQSGIVFFPGSAPLYKLGFLLVGGLGVSGDGVDQDDYVTAGGLLGYEAHASIRADQISVRGVRLPYLKFPREPEGGR